MTDIAEGKKHGGLLYLITANQNIKCTWFTLNTFNKQLSLLQTRLSQFILQ